MIIRKADAETEAGVTPSAQLATVVMKDDDVDPATRPVATGHRI
jgi:hypothetical protein